MRRLFNILTDKLLRQNLTTPIIYISALHSGLSNAPVCNLKVPKEVSGELKTHVNPGQHGMLGWSFVQPPVYHATEIILTTEDLALLRKGVHRENGGKDNDDRAEGEAHDD
ncbi:hypothetical protein D9615_004262 [Tricholomella constricta]|uniref:Uncharacterized protein n=1 Tax=Tricholomella constricta TaxID=117010 RepID=A0A8H5HF36_9AGAR|nr:hypothetical protein D9615_004262 [Tricholomella constricta]